MMTPISAVAIDEDQSWFYFLWDLIGGNRAHLQCFPNPDSGVRCAIDRSARIVILDPATRDLDVPQTLGRIFRVSRATQMVLVAGHQSGDAAILATRLGLSDYRSKFVHLRDFRAQISPASKPDEQEWAN